MPACAVRDIGPKCRRGSGSTQGRRPRGLAGDRAASIGPGQRHSKPVALLSTSTSTTVCPLLSGLYSLSHPGQLCRIDRYRPPACTLSSFPTGPPFVASSSSSSIDVTPPPPPRALAPSLPRLNPCPGSTALAQASPPAWPLLLACSLPRARDHASAPASRRRPGRPQQPPSARAARRPSCSPPRPLPAASTSTIANARPQPRSGRYGRSGLACSSRLTVRPAAACPSALRRSAS
jgi:hypothetical protein